MKLYPVTEDLKVGLGPGEPVQCFVRYILDLPATEADEVMMERHVRIEARPFMSDVDLAHKTPFSKHSEGVVHGIARNHRMPAFHSPIQIIRRRVTGRPSQSTVNGGALRRQPHMVMTKPLPYCLGRWSHTYLGMIPR